MVRCIRCFNTLKESCFYRYANEKLRQPCKDCISNDNKKYRAVPENLERKNCLQRERYRSDVQYRQRVLRKSKHYRKKHYLKSKFNLTENQVEALRINQNNRCPICLQQFDSIKMKHCIDHCHTTGVVRGLLCPLCNKGIGLFKDSPECMQRAIEYLSNQKDYR
jgi:hypothetical protein